MRPQRADNGNVSGRSRVSVQVVLVPRRGRTPQAAYQVAVGKLAKEGWKALRLVSYTIDRDKQTNLDMFLLRVEVEPAAPADHS
jgi:hypothetical protein